MKRRYPTEREKAEILERQQGTCAAIGCKSTGPFEYDHELSLWIHGDNSTANFRALCIECHKVKTAKDAKDRAKIKRILIKASRAEREKRKRKRIHGRPFDTRLRKKINGKTVPREGAARMA